MSINIKSHKLNIPSKIIDRCWDIYSRKYKNIESSISSNSVSFSSHIQDHLHATGAFQISIEKAKSLDDDSLKKYFLSSDNSLLAIKTKTKYILRGADYYVGMQKLSNIKKSKVIFSRLIEMIKILRGTQTKTNIILYLSILDHIRNYLMILLYSMHQLGREYGFPKEIKIHYLRFIKLIEQIEFEYLFSISNFKIDSQKEYTEYIPSLRFIESFLNKSIEQMYKYDNLKDDLFRKMRESDNPEKIYHFSKKVAESYLPQNSVLIGIEYGGIELPFVINAYRKMLGKNTLQVMTVNLSSYSVGTDKYVDKLEDAISPFFAKEKIAKFDTALILDDAITTGRTLEYLVKLLPENICSIYFRCISFTNTNRYHHLTRFEHGGVNPIIFDEETALWPSSYTQTFSRESYTNRQGVFNKDKERIVNIQKKYYPNLIN